MEKITKKFHFQELDWIIGFPDSVNKGRKYLYYSVFFTDGKKRRLPEKVCLGDVLENPEFEKNLPHIVGFYKESTSNARSETPAYLEIRRICSIEEFWKFLNDTDI